MNKILEIQMGIALSVKNSTSLYIKILAQDDAYIRRGRTRFTSDKYEFELLSQNMPEITDTAFYLRGTDHMNDHKTIYKTQGIGETNEFVKNLLRVLEEYATYLAKKLSQNILLIPTDFDKVSIINFGEFKEWFFILF